MARKNTGDNLLALANVLTSFATLGSDLLRPVALSRSRKIALSREYLHQQGLALKNELIAARLEHERVKQQVTSNREVQTGLNIDATKLKLIQAEFRAWTAGVIEEKDLQYYHPQKFASVE